MLAMSPILLRPPVTTAAEHAGPKRTLASPPAQPSGRPAYWPPVLAFAVQSRLQLKIQRWSNSGRFTENGDGWAIKPV